MEAAFMFLSGLLFGASLVLVWGQWQIQKMKKTKKVLLDQIKTKVLEEDKKQKSIKDRLFQASELAQTQMTIRAMIEEPSKGALHSKYKNELVYEMRDIEQKKIDILQTIIADGYDPIITVTNDSGTKSEIPLSAYIKETVAILNKSTGGQPPPLPPVPANAKRSGKFIVYKGGKDDGTTH